MLGRRKISVARTLDTTAWDTRYPSPSYWVPLTHESRIESLNFNVFSEMKELKQIGVETLTARTRFLVEKEKFVIFGPRCSFVRCFIHGTLCNSYKYRLAFRCCRLSFMQKSDSKYVRLFKSWTHALPTHALCMYVCMYIWMYVCTYVCVSLSNTLCIYVCFSPQLSHLLGFSPCLSLYPCRVHIK